MGDIRVQVRRPRGFGPSSSSPRRTAGAGHGWRGGAAVGTPAECGRRRAVAAVAGFCIAFALRVVGADAGVERDAAQTALADSCPPAYARSLDDAARKAAIETLFERSEGEIKSGDFAAAAAAFDCVEVISSGSADWRIDYELTRRRGVLAYYREQIAESLELFERALNLASSHGDALAEAKSWKNVGSALRRLGDFRRALQALLTSLDIYRRSGVDAVGPVLNNIADVYRDLQEPAQARKYYDEALEAYRRQGDAVEEAHALESLSVLALDGGDAQHAEALLQQAMGIYVERGAQTHQLRVYAGLARAAVARHDPAAAAQWAERGLALAASLNTPPPAPLVLQAAAAERLRGDPAAASTRLRRTLAQLAADDAERPALLDELARSDEAAGDLAGALSSLREFHQADLARRKAAYDSELRWLRTRFETAERDRTIAALAAENDLRALTIRQRTTVLWLTAAVSATGLLALTLLLYRRRQRARMTEVAHAARLAEEVERHRRAAADLMFDRRLLQAALDSRTDAVVVLDAAAVVVAASADACRLLGRSSAAVVGRPFAEALASDAATALTAALERIDESRAAERLEARLAGVPDRLALHLAPVEQDEDLVIVALRPADVVVESAAPPALEVAPGAGEPDPQAGFRRALVELMLAVVEAWERSSGLGRLELAEKSRIWRVTVDDGRLRARAMERYLSLARLPSLPRWRDVLRSAYFVLAECTLDEPQRAELQRHVDAVLAYTRLRALV
jgi:tetratricopeptide (TPR) repeat protein